MLEVKDSLNNNRFLRSNYVLIQSDHSFGQASKFNQRKSGFGAITREDVCKKISENSIYCERASVEPINIALRWGEHDPKRDKGFGLVHIKHRHPDLLALYRNYFSEEAVEKIYEDPEIVGSIKKIIDALNSKEHSGRAKLFFMPEENRFVLAVEFKNNEKSLFLKCVLYPTQSNLLEIVTLYSVDESHFNYLNSNDKYILLQFDEEKKVHVKEEAKLPENDNEKSNSAENKPKKKKKKKKSSYAKLHDKLDQQKSVELVNVSLLDHEACYTFEELILDSVYEVPKLKIDFDIKDYQVMMKAHISANGSLKGIMREVEEGHKAYRDLFDNFKSIEKICANILNKNCEDPLMQEAIKVLRAAKEKSRGYEEAEAKLRDNSDRRFNIYLKYKKSLTQFLSYIDRIGLNKAVDLGEQEEFTPEIEKKVNEFWDSPKLPLYAKILSLIRHSVKCKAYITNFYNECSIYAAKVIQFGNNDIAAVQTDMYRAMLSIFVRLAPENIESYVQFRRIINEVYLQLKGLPLIVFCQNKDFRDDEKDLLRRIQNDELRLIMNQLMDFDTESQLEYKTAATFT